MSMDYMANTFETIFTYLYLLLWKAGDPECMS